MYVKCTEVCFMNPVQTLDYCPNVLSTRSHCAELISDATFSGAWEQSAFSGRLLRRGTSGQASSTDCAGVWRAENR